MSLSRETTDAGEYRLRESVSVTDSLLVSRQPLTATRLNDPAIEIVRELSDGSFRSPATLADRLSGDAESIRNLCHALFERGFLDWRPSRRPEYRPPVSVIVTVRNERASIEACLDALGSLSYPDYEVIVVDDGSTDGTKELTAEHALAAEGRLRIERVGSDDQPLGIGASRNRGVDVASNDIVAFTDADCRPTQSWLQDLVPCLASHDVIGGRIRPAGSTAASEYEGINSSLDMGAYAARVRPGGDVPYLATANLVGRREVFEAIPFPDRNVAEDVGFCWRALEAGYDIVYVPDGIVTHEYRDSVRSLSHRRAAYGASEALLATEYDHDSSRRAAVPIDLGFGALFGSVGVLASGPIATVLLILALGTLLAGSGLRLGSAIRTKIRVGDAVTWTDLVRSQLRQVVSTTYAVSRELTRYYAILIAFVGAVATLWSPTIGAAVLAALLIVVSLPIVVECAIHRPSSIAYVAYYLADHGGYQRGVYRGLLAYRTLRPVNPFRRFRLATSR